MTVETIDTAAFGREWAAWHRKREACGPIRLHTRLSLPE